MHSKFHSILSKNGQENGAETRVLAGKNCIIEKTHFEVLLMQASHKRCVLCIDSFWKHVIIYIRMESLIISLYMEMSTTQNSLKKIPPEIRPATQYDFKFNRDKSGHSITV